jgi:hypothetical protein
VKNVTLKPRRVRACAHLEETMPPARAARASKALNQTATQIVEAKRRSGEREGGSEERRERRKEVCDRQVERDAAVRWAERHAVGVCHAYGVRAGVSLRLLVGVSVVFRLG